MQQKDLASIKELASKRQQECDEYRQRVEDLSAKVEEGKKIIADNSHGKVILLKKHETNIRKEN
jgi:AmiR/NasT family two-component response regulator